ncbi:unnamed protein product [Pleuronectes platessa]|uniref:Uncharacterized protein n=1 Tax=Pleuronectes platessa TaxID=8262 RepID=A0A9N7UYU8_PLEPL|nr:unnamed protein product [Pleuronectes platessa]
MWISGPLQWEEVSVWIPPPVARGGTKHIELQMMEFKPCGGRRPSGTPHTHFSPQTSCASRSDAAKWVMVHERLQKSAPDLNTCGTLEEDTEASLSSSSSGEMENLLLQTPPGSEITGV